MVSVRLEGTDKVHREQQVCAKSQYWVIDLE